MNVIEVLTDDLAVKYEELRTLSLSAQSLDDHRDFETFKGASNFVMASLLRLESLAEHSTSQQETLEEFLVEFGVLKNTSHGIGHHIGVEEVSKALSQHLEV